MSGRCFWCCFAYVSASLRGLVLPKVARKKCFPCQVRFLDAIFGSELLFLAFVSGFLVLFCRWFCCIMWHCSPGSRLKHFFLSGVPGVFCSFSLVFPFSFPPGGPAGAGALFLCCSSFCRQASTTSDLGLRGISVALPLAPSSPPFCSPISPPVAGGLPFLSFCLSPSFYLFLFLLHAWLKRV